MIQRVLDKFPDGTFAFACIGVVGFVIEATILTALIKQYGWNPYSARVVSFGIAVTVLWYLNRRWTFAQHASVNKRKEYIRYVTVTITGALLNFGIYSAGIEMSETMETYPALALAAGTVAAMIFNFTGSRRFVFAGQGQN